MTVCSCMFGVSHPLLTVYNYTAHSALKESEQITSDRQFARYQFKGETLEHLHAFTHYRGLCDQLFI